MDNELTNFSFRDRPVRIVEKDGDPWFVAKDVCDILEIQNVSQALQNLDDDEAGICKVYTSSENGVSQYREMSGINESGLYNLIFRSNKPEAKTFRKWVTAEVLPAIRKHGYFSVRPPLAIDPDIDFKGVALMLKAFSLGAITGAEFRRTIGLAPQDYQLDDYSPYRETGRLRFDTAIARDDVRLFIEKGTVFETDAITPIFEIYEAYRDHYGIDDISIRNGEALSRVAFTRFVFREYPNVSGTVAHAGTEKKIYRCYRGLKLQPPQLLCEEQGA